MPWYPPRYTQSRGPSLLLTSVHVEQYWKCASAHVSYSFLNSGCKTTIFCWFHRYAKYSSLRNQKRVVRGASLCPVLPFVYVHSALILQNCFSKSTFFRSFALVARSYSVSAIKINAIYFVLLSTFRNFVDRFRTIRYEITFASGAMWNMRNLNEITTQIIWWK